MLTDILKSADWSSAWDWRMAGIIAFAVVVWVVKEWRKPPKKK